MPSVDLKEVLIKQAWADEIDRYQKELLNMAARITSIRDGLATLKITIDGSVLSTVNDGNLINGAVNFLNSANITNFEAAVNANLPIL